MPLLRLPLNPARWSLWATQLPNRHELRLPTVPLRILTQLRRKMYTYRSQLWSEKQHQHLSQMQRWISTRKQWKMLFTQTWMQLCRRTMYLMPSTICLQCHTWILFYRRMLKLLHRRLRELRNRIYSPVQQLQTPQLPRFQIRQVPRMRSWLCFPFWRHLCFQRWVLWQNGRQRYLHQVHV